MKYVCYDIRGIQSFIFRIPKLKYIIGGSALIDQFDRETVRNLQLPEGCKCLFAGGGKGTFSCPDVSSAQAVQQKIMDCAHSIGLDIRFGCSENYVDASLNATSVYPYVPASLEGKPCPVSGLYPVLDGKSHPIIQKRFFYNGEKIFRWYENELLKNMEWPEELSAYKNGMFFHNVNDRVRDGSNDESGARGSRALGKRNRWAVICMDGNDMGSQLRAKSEELKAVAPEEMTKWLQTMSSAIDNCSREATKAGILAVIEAWANSKDDDRNLSGEEVVLPIRPIIVGGDDISVICHASYAMLFVKAVVNKFNELSKKTPEAWPATGGEITISAGVLFCSVSLPLHSAVSYAESLLASAKGHGRKFAQKGKPAVPCIDWEMVTESVIDTPAARRQRELIFMDEDINKTVCLTQRPCTLDEFEKIEELSKRYMEYPNTTLRKVLPAMQKGFYDRLAFIAKIAKRKRLVEDLAEPGFELNGCKTKWVEEGNVRSTPVIDAIQLVEEINRMEKETA